MVFCDLAKAFDCMNHSIWLQMLNYYGVQGETLNWFTTHLENRKKRVEQKSQFACKYSSKSEIVKCGQWVPVTMA